MAVAVVGFDIGHQSSYVAVARTGGIETVCNEYSDRFTVTCVSFGERNRMQGFAAKQQQNSNMKNTLVGFTRFLGRDFKDPLVKSELDWVAYNVFENPVGTAAFEVRYLNEKTVVTPEQATAMMLTKLKEVAEGSLGSAVKDCVINVPTYYTDAERRAMLDAAQIAGLNCLKLINDTTATSLSYGIYKKDLPEAEEQARIVVFVDLGHSNLEVAAVAFNNGKMKVLGTACDPNLGGRDFDKAIYNVMAAEFQQRYRVDANSSQKARVRLLAECEKLKKLMSANSTEIPLNLECFMDDKDVSARMKRETFEGLVSDLLQRIEAVFELVLSSAQLQKDEIYSVELTGGSSRIPAVKQLVKKVFGLDPSTTLNADESVARGCALQCAILSPAFRVRDFSITDSQPYSITLDWDEHGRPDSAEIFSVQHSVPFSRMMTFSRREPFAITARYTNPEMVPHSCALIGRFNVTGVKSTPEGDPAKVKVKARVNHHGIFTICQAQMAEKYEVEVVEAEPEPMDTKEPAAATPEATETAANGPSEPPAPEEQPMETESTPETGENGEVAPAAKETKKKIKTRYHDLPVEFSVRQLDKTMLNLFVEREAQMKMQDKQENERSNAKNAVEEYVYEMRDKLSTTLEEFVTEEERESFSVKLTATEDWLYDEGEEQSKQVYIDRLHDMQNIGDRFVSRHREWEKRPGASDALGRALQSFSKAIEAFRAGDERYNHLDAADVDKVAKALEEKQQWFISQSNLQSQKKKCEDPVLTASQIKHATETLFAVANPVITKPKPPPPKEEPPVDTADNNKNGDTGTATPADTEKSPKKSGKRAASEQSQENNSNSASGDTAAEPPADGETTKSKPTDSKEDMELD